MKIELKVNNRTTKQISPKCRCDNCNDDPIDIGEKYIAISAFINTNVTICLKLSHANEFIKQTKDVLKQVEEIEKANW